MIDRVPVEIGREQAAALAREELAKQVYRDARPGLVERLLRWAVHHLLAALDSVAGVSPGGYVGVVIVLLLVAVAVVALRLRVGPMARSDASGTALFTDRTLTAAQHAAAADRHAANGEWAEAVRERLRAIVRGLEERAVLDERPGRTADEAAAEAGAALPDCAANLRSGARLFDDVWYGGRPAGPESDAALRRLDQRVRATRTLVAPR